MCASSILIKSFFILKTRRAGNSLSNDNEISATADATYFNTFIKIDNSTTVSQAATALARICRTPCSKSYQKAGFPASVICDFSPDTSG